MPAYRAYKTPLKPCNMPLPDKNREHAEAGLRITLVNYLRIVLSPTQILFF